MTTEPPLRVGDRVLYFAYGTPGGEFPAGVPRAAIVTDVVEGMPRLAIFNPTGMFFSDPLPRRNPKLTSGCWDWTDGPVQGIAPVATTVAASEIPHLCAICFEEIRTNDVFYTTTDGEMICAYCRARGEA